MDAHGEDLGLGEKRGNVLSVESAEKHRRHAWRASAGDTVPSKRLAKPALHSRPSLRTQRAQCEQAAAQEGSSESGSCIRMAITASSVSSGSG